MKRTSKMILLAALVAFLFFISLDSCTGGDTNSPTTDASTQTSDASSTDINEDVVNCEDECSEYCSDIYGECPDVSCAPCEKHKKCKKCDSCEECPECPEAEPCPEPTTRANWCFEMEDEEYDFDYSLCFSDETNCRLVRQEWHRAGSDGIGAKPGFCLDRPILQ